MEMSQTRSKWQGVLAEFDSDNLYQKLPLQIAHKRKPVEY
jgi:hypothetical protein